MKRDKYDELIHELMLATMSGKIGWEVTNSGNGFQVKIGNNSVSIFCCDSYKVASIVGGEDSEIQSGTLTIINAKGESIEFYTRRKDDVGFEQLKELFVKIRRKINKVDEVIVDILKELEK